MRLPKELITPEEAAQLFLKYGTVDGVKRAGAVLDAFIAASEEKYGKQDGNRLWALGAIYAAGRLQGIREQRSKIKHPTQAGV